MKILLLLCFVPLVFNINHLTTSVRNLNEGTNENESSFVFMKLLDSLLLRCPQNFLRVSQITFRNQAGSGFDLQYDSMYMNPQQIVALGSTTITPGTQSRWMSTPQGRSTGASGLINYIFDNKKIVSFYENPWSGWTTGGGVCVFQSSFTAQKAQYDVMYKSLVDLGNKAPVTTNPYAAQTDGSCIYITNFKSKSVKKEVNSYGVLNGVGVGLGYVYSNPFNTVFQSCWVVSMSVQVAAKST